MDYQGLPKVYQYTDSKNISLISARPAYRYSLLSKTFNYPPLVFFLILYFPALVFCLMVLPCSGILPHDISPLWYSSSLDFPTALVFCLMIFPCPGILPHGAVCQKVFAKQLQTREFVIVENIRLVFLLVLTADFGVKTKAKLTP